MKLDELEAFAVIFSSLTAFLSMSLTVWGINVQKKQVKPIGYIAEIYHQNFLAVRIRNVGGGTMYIDKCEIKRGKNEESKRNLIEFMPIFEDGIIWTSFSLEIEKRTILPGDHINLFVMDLKEIDDEELRKRIHDDILLYLRGISVKIIYHGIFRKKYTYEKMLKYSSILTSDFPYKAR